MRSERTGPEPSAVRGGCLPRPALSVLVAMTWLLLQQSLELPQLITAGVLGLTLPPLLRGFLASPSRVRRFPLMFRLVIVVLSDIITANLAVARIVLFPRLRPRPAWVPVALELHDPTAIVLLAAIITTTPGTVSCVIDEQQRRIIVHALDCADPAALAAQIKQRYERPLREIFE